MNIKPVIWCLIFFGTSIFGLSAQKISVKTHIDSTSMWIGNQTKLSFQVTQPKELQVTFPIFSDSLSGGIEIVDKVKMDTLPAENGNITITHSYSITAFDDSLITIPSYPFVAGGDTVWSNAVTLQMIQPYQIDTVKSKINDIKPVFNASIYWWGIIRIILLVLLIVALIVAAYFVFRKYFKRNTNDLKISSEPELPPYYLAISKLDKIKEEKLWQRNRSKEYHTLITDVVREYIDKVFGVPSLEMTSEEILFQLRFLKTENKSAYTSLEQILKLADLVKFAKFEPLPDEHESSLNYSYSFINQTKPEEPISDSKNQKDLMSEIE